MHVATVAAPSGLWRRAMPLACGCALAAAGAYVALNDPSAAGSRFPSCYFHSTTGLWCPGCGLTRGFHQLLTGHPLAALGYNIFVPLVLVAIVGSWLNWVRTSWGQRAYRVPAWASRATATVLPVVLVLYAVLRNIPAAPFRALAP